MVWERCCHVSRYVEAHVDKRVGKGPNNAPFSTFIYVQEKVKELKMPIGIP